jgi:flavin reductase ActVB
MSSANDLQTAEAAIRALYDAYNRHDVEAVARLYAEGATHEDVAQGRVGEGPDAIRTGLEHFFAAVPDAHWAAERIIGHRDRATASYTMTGTVRGRLGASESRGQVLGLAGVHVVETGADGRIVRSSDYWDALELERQLRGEPAGAPAPDAQALHAVDVPAVAPDGFRKAMSLLAGGVAVVTTVIDDRPWGLTVSACCSLTAEPPQVLVSLHSSTASCRAIVDSGHFGVALLGADQVEVARVCSASGRPKFIEGLVDRSFEHSRSPVIADALAHLDCQVVDSHRVGDHLLLIGLVAKVLSPRTHQQLEPLVYFERAFRTVGAALS